MAQRTPQRGEIWFFKPPTDPPDKNPRPVLVVSTEAVTRNPRANTILIVPLTGSIEREMPTHIPLAPGETGLAQPSAVKAEEITTVRKESLLESKFPLRTLSNTKICEIAEAVRVAMGCPRKA